MLQINPPTSVRNIFQLILTGKDWDKDYIAVFYAAARRLKSYFSRCLFAVSCDSSKDTVDLDLYLSLVQRDLTFVPKTGRQFSKRRHVPAPLR